MSLPPDFRDLLVEFARERVEYALVGGYAFAFHVPSGAQRDRPAREPRLHERVVGEE